MSEDFVTDGDVQGPEGLDLSDHVSGAAAKTGGIGCTMGGSGISASYEPGQCPNPELFADGLTEIASKTGPMFSF